jgi:nitrite reductase/ring-hydroxylating ferredoxin subunit
VTHVVARSRLSENGTLTFEVAGAHYLVVDVDGEVMAFAVDGPAAGRIDRAAIAEGRLRCPLHGWPIDHESGQCGAAELCRYRRLPVEIHGGDIRVELGGR